MPDVKPDHKWCPHAGKGTCNIYPDRPQPCRDFKCLWLMYPGTWAPHWYPKTAHIVIDLKVNDHGTFLAFVVDPNYPTRWREEPWFSDIKRAAREGLFGPKKWTTVVMLRGEITQIGK